MSSRRRSNKRRRKDEGRQEAATDVSARQRYWHRRHSLFALFDLGVVLDEESWYSVTPQVLAEHHAARCAGGVVVDACCGVGGNAIQLARTCGRVIAIDIDAEKIAMGKENAAIYGVTNIEWLCGDFAEIAKQLPRVDGVFLSPPWGGPSYKNQTELTLRDFPVNVELLWRAARRLTPNIAMFLPRNLSVESLKALGETVEVESNYVDDRCLAITAYFGSFVQKNV